MTIRRPRLVMPITIVCCLLAGVSYAQRPVHYFHAADMPPGTVGQAQLLRYPALRGFTQPVEMLVPAGARVSVNLGGYFDEPHERSVIAGMQVGHVYQLKVSSIPYHEGFEVFPTIEVINALCPPEGKALRFPVPIEFTQEELEMALEGRYVTRVVYLEDQETALPRRDDPAHQRYFEAGPDQDPLFVADQLGRPMLIMRMGSRVPDQEELASGPIAAAPPAVVYPPLPASTPSPVESAIDRSGAAIPRVEVPRNGRPPQIPQPTPIAP